ncbi:hypothetical protein H4F47_14675 [Pectobacterium brasiliense]|uniref:hypothetical protein n=1 Tax=Enterobacterales TaxID=91347 RepID=UPI0019690E17|nr:MULTISPECIES: hypothetical protein [Enterobacterales]MBN3044158.1 hypothetical protein [Pectobacterium brasiliense]MBS0899910.1 hypothetical protein [Pantoea dispersa]MDY4324185.1 hypothetical protein [Pectobacterium brasiliense]
MYQNTIDSLKKTQTAAQHISGLGKILTSTEDPQLKRLVDVVYSSLQRAHRTAKAGKSTPGHFYNSPDNNIRGLIAYCESHIQAGKPEWQVMAERHGWTPPASA